MKEAKNDEKQEFSDEENIQSEKYLTFFIDGQLYCIPTAEVVEIIQMQPITFIPNVTDYVKGVINLRGKVVPVIDMRLRFKKKEKEYNSRTSIVIVESGEKTAGLIVESVKDVRDVSANQINAAPTLKKAIGNGFVRGIASLGEKSAMILDIGKVLTHHSSSGLNKSEKTEQEKVQDEPVA
jgi:purine-binding chemotaxis protein CheW